MPDTNPACRTAFRSISESVRHPSGTLSGITPECCPPSVRNPVRRGPDYAEAEQQIWNECSRLIANAIIYYNTLLLSRVYEHKLAANDQAAIEILKGISPAAWRNVNLT